MTPLLSLPRPSKRFCMREGVREQEWIKRKRESKGKKEKERKEDKQSSQTIFDEF